MAEAYIGEIRMFGGTYAPQGWALCNGQILSISQNSALFAVLGVTYGGNGSTTFALPNFQGRVPVHFGQLPGGSNYPQGAALGEEKHALLASELPIHSHNTTVTVGVQADASNGSAISPSGNYLAQSASGSGRTATTLNTYSPSPTNPVSLNGVSTTVTNGPAGGGQPHNVLQPLLVVNFIICLQGIYPTRS